MLFKRLLGIISLIFLTTSSLVSLSNFKSSSFLCKIIFRTSSGLVATQSFDLEVFQSSYMFWCVQHQFLLQVHLLKLDLFVKGLGKHVPPFPRAPILKIVEN